MKEIVIHYREAGTFIPRPISPCRPIREFRARSTPSQAEPFESNVMEKLIISKDDADVQSTRGPKKTKPAVQGTARNPGAVGEAGEPDSVTNLHFSNANL